MSFQKHEYYGYRSYDYLGGNGRASNIKLSRQADRVVPFILPLSADEERRYEYIINNYPVISIHDHFRILPEDPAEIATYYHSHHVASGYEGIAQSPLDAFIGNTVLKGTSWDETILELGIRMCDARHSGLVVPASSTDEILRAKENGKVAWLPMIEHLSSIGDEPERIEALYGLGVRMAGLVFSESNMLGGGLAERSDGGLTALGRKAVNIMNLVGMPIDLSHAGDLTTMQAVEESRLPVVIGHAGARSIWGTKRMKPDEVIKACVNRGGLFGIEAAPHTTMSHSHPEHDLESVMEHFEYVKELVGIDGVTFGPDTMYGDHVGLHRQNADSYGDDSSDEKFTFCLYVKGCENPTECWKNIPRWLILHGYSDEEIAKVIGGNTLRYLKNFY